jgi:hypothetical protein
VFLSGPLQARSAVDKQVYNTISNASFLLINHSHVRQRRLSDLGLKVLPDFPTIEKDQSVLNGLPTHLHQVLCKLDLIFEIEHRQHPSGFSFLSIFSVLFIQILVLMRSEVPVIILYFLNDEDSSSYRKA